MVALYFDFEFLKVFEQREDKLDPIVYDFYNLFFKSIRGVEVYVNIQSMDELEQLIKTNEIYWFLSEINSPVILNFKEKLSDAVFYK